MTPSTYWLSSAANCRPQVAKLELKDGTFLRPASTFRNFISKDPNSKFPAEKGRYALYLSPGCPWVRLAMDYGEAR
jgi:glutathionyl-hydroquinone reductase